MRQSFFLSLCRSKLGCYFKKRMKKFLATIILTCCSVYIFAQKNDFKTELYIGLSGGETFTKVRFYPNIVESYLQGNSQGIVFRLISEPHIGFQAEVNMTQKGWKEDSVGYSRRLNYITIPIMTHVNLGKKAVRFTLNLGPEIGFNLSEKETFSDPATTQLGGFGNREFFGQPVDSKIDLLFTVGIGMEYHFKNGSAFALEGRGFYSLPNLFDHKKYSYSISQSNGIQVKLAYLFQLKKKKN
jgi:Outer membrane protein beta-barrel domain